MAVDTNTERTKALTSLLQGAAIVVLILWAVVSWAPFVDLIYPGSAGSTIVNILFITTSFPAVGSVYLVLLLVLSDHGRKAFQAARSRTLRSLSLLAAAWIVLYPIAS